MTKDIVERLREHAKLAALAMYKIHICWEAADEIERLRSYVIRLTADNDALRAELEWLRQRRNASPCSKR